MERFYKHIFIASCVVSAVFVVVVVIPQNKSVCAAQPETCGNSSLGANNTTSNGNSCGNTISMAGSNCGNTNPPPPPPPPCTLNIDKSVVQAGTTTLGLSWSPTPTNNVSLRRGSVALTVPARTTTFSDSFVAGGNSIRYSMSYQATTTQGRRDTFVCNATVRVVPVLAECNDGVDNDSDGTSDRNDPGCHTDGNPTNNGTYTPTDDSESNPRPDLVPTISAAQISATNPRVEIEVTVENRSNTYAALNEFVYGWRNIDATADVPQCGPSGNRCFTYSGRSYRILDTETRTYAAHQVRPGDSVFRPTLPGRYQLCNIADYDNVIVEQNESNNVSCITVNVDVSGIATVVYTEPSLTADPARVRKGNTSTLLWDLGGRIDCTITGTNGENFSVNSDGAQPTRELTSETTYTLSCTEDGATDTAKVGILPQLQEF